MSGLKSFSRCLMLALVALGACGTDARAQTGDGAIDGWIAPYNSYRGGNNLPPASIQPGNYAYFNACHSPSAPAGENNCPSDLTYTPLAGAGGYQAYGVGVFNQPEGHYWAPYCYYEWYYDPNLDREIWFFVCSYYYVGYLPDQTFGTAAARIRFSQLTVLTPAGFYEYLSTLAFKSVNTHWNLENLFCRPILSWVPAESKCDPAKQDAYVIPFTYPYEPPNPGVGYDDKIHVDNPNCSSPVRTDTFVDRQLGCFAGYDSNWWSDLPAPFADTSVTDAPNPYVTTIGTVQPWAIQEGYLYSWQRNFWAYGLNNLASTEAKHFGGVTMWFDTFPCNGTPQICSFSVDQTRIGPNAPMQ
jgi:hypothetical protein